MAVPKAGHTTTSQTLITLGPKPATEPWKHRSAIFREAKVLSHELSSQLRRPALEAQRSHHRDALLAARRQAHFTQTRSTALPGLPLPAAPSSAPSGTSNTVQAKIQEAFQSDNAHGSMIVSYGQPQLQDAINNWNQENPGNQIEIRPLPPEEHPNKQTGHVFYTLKIGEKTVIFSEMVIAQDESPAIDLQTKLSDAFMAHMAASTNHFEMQKGSDPLLATKLDELAENLNKNLVTMIGAQWVDSLPTPIPSKSGLDCGFAASHNLAHLWGYTDRNNRPLAPKDLAEHLLGTNDRDLKIGLFSTEMLWAIFSNQTYTLNKDDFINNLSGDANKEQRLLYASNTINSTNGNTETTAQEIWAHFVSISKPTVINPNEITSLELTPNDWYKAIGTIAPHTLAEVLSTNNCFAFDHFNFNYLHLNSETDTTDFEDELRKGFALATQKASADNSNNKPLLVPALIATQNNTLGGVNNHFVCMFLQNHRWYTVDSNKPHTEFACKEGELLTYFKRNKIADLIYPTLKPTAFN